MPDVTSVPEAQKEERYQKELDEIRNNIRGDIRIKLKRDGKGGGSYSWEISGRDASEVLKANNALKKGLPDDAPGKKGE